MTWASTIGGHVPPTPIFDLHSSDWLAARRIDPPPILPGAGFHGLRHHHKTVLDELGIEDALTYERMGHQMPGIAGVYSHVTDPMRENLLQQRWADLDGNRP